MGDLLDEVLADVDRVSADTGLDEAIARRARPDHLADVVRSSQRDATLAGSGGSPWVEELRDILTGPDSELGVAALSAEPEAELLAEIDRVADLAALEELAAPSAQAPVDPGLVASPDTVERIAAPLPPSQVADLPAANAEMAATIRERRNEAVRIMQADQAAARAVQPPSLLRRVTDYLGFTEPGQPGPASEPEPTAATPEDVEELPSHLRYAVEPVVTRLKELYGVYGHFKLGQLAAEIVEAEADYRIRNGLFDQGEVKKVNWDDWFATLPLRAQGLWYAKGVVAERRGSTFYDKTALENHIHDELMLGLPMYGEKAHSLQLGYYDKLRKLTPADLPPAKGFFRKMAQFGGNLAPLVAELAVVRRPLGGLARGVTRRTASRALGETARTAAGFGLRAATVPGGEPAKEAAFGAVLGGAQAVGGALAGARGLPRGAGRGVGTGVTFGTAAAMEPGAGVEDVLIAGVVAPILFHAQDIIRYPFRPRQLVPAGYRGERIPNTLDEMRDSRLLSQRLIYRFLKLAETPEATAEIRATARSIQRLYDQARRTNFRDMSPAERAVLEEFITRYSPAEVLKRRGVPADEAQQAEQKARHRPIRAKVRREPAATPPEPRKPAATPPEPPKPAPARPEAARRTAKPASLRDIREVRHELLRVTSELDRTTDPTKQRELMDRQDQLRARLRAMDPEAWGGGIGGAPRPEIPATPKAPVSPPPEEFFAGIENEPDLLAGELAEWEQAKREAAEAGDAEGIFRAEAYARWLRAQMPIAPPPSTRTQPPAAPTREPGVPGPPEPSEAPETPKASKVTEVTEEEVPEIPVQTPAQYFASIRGQPLSLAQARLDCLRGLDEIGKPETEGEKAVVQRLNAMVRWLSKQPGVVEANEELARQRRVELGEPEYPPEGVRTGFMAGGGGIMRAPERPAEIPQAAAATKRLYWHGDEAEYTGKSEMLHGKTAYEARVIEGHRKGELVWTYRAPEPVEPVTHERVKEIAGILRRDLGSSRAGAEYARRIEQAGGDDAELYGRVAAMLERAAHPPTPKGPIMGIPAIAGAKVEPSGEREPPEAGKPTRAREAAWPDDPDQIYEMVLKNEGPEPARLVRALLDANILTVETHASKEHGINVRVAYLDDVNRSIIGATYSGGEISGARVQTDRSLTETPGFYQDMIQVAPGPDVAFTIDGIAEMIRHQAEPPGFGPRIEVPEPGSAEAIEATAKTFETWQEFAPFGTRVIMPDGTEATVLDPSKLRLEGDEGFVFTEDDVAAMGRAGEVLVEQPDPESPSDIRREIIEASELQPVEEPAGIPGAPKVSEAPETNEGYLVPGTRVVVTFEGKQVQGVIMSDAEIAAEGVGPHTREEMLPQGRVMVRLETPDGQRLARFYRADQITAVEPRPGAQPPRIIEEEPPHEPGAEPGPGLVEGPAGGPVERPRRAGEGLPAPEAPEGVPAPPGQRRAPEGPVPEAEAGRAGDLEGRGGRPGHPPVAGAGGADLVSDVGTGSGARSPGAAGVPGATGRGAAQQRPGPVEQVGAQGGEAGRPRHEEMEGPTGGAGPPTTPTVESPAGLTGDYIIQPGEIVFPAGEKTRTRANLEAIRIVKRLAESGEDPTPEERRALVQYTGWGSNRSIFKGWGWHPDPKWESEYKDLENLLDEDELATAQRSTQWAMFTPPAVIREMWSAVRRLGFRGGHVLEPAAGVGHFFGAAPPELRRVTGRVAIEIDKVSGAIAELLYPDSNVRIQGFEEALLPKGFFDVIITNVPFGDVAVFDQRYAARLRRQIHDYFFVRSMDLLRPGGVLAAITSTGSMDKRATTIREYLSDQADLVGAIRLHENMLAGTKVTADIIFLQKREPGAQLGGEAWVESRKIKVEDPKSGSTVERYVNEYFINNPDQVLGKIVAGSLYGRGGGPTDSIVIETDGAPTLPAAIAALPDNVMGTKPDEAPTVPSDPVELIPAEKDMPYYAMVLREGKLHQVMRDGSMAPIEQAMIGKHEAAAKPDAKSQKRARGVAMTKIAKARALVQLRDQVLKLQRAMLGKADEAELAADQAELNRIYDAFAKKHGPIHKTNNLAAIVDDAYTRSIVRSLEHYDKQRKTATKGSIFTRRVLEPEPEEQVETIDDALAVMLNEGGGVLDMERIAEMLGSTADQVEQRGLSQGLWFKEPAGPLVVADEYLSGDVREKLRQAQAAAEIEPDTYSRNVEALQGVIPDDLGPEDIAVGLGVTWVPLDIMQAFIDHLFGRGMTVRYEKATNRWAFSGKSAVRHRVASTDTWGTQDVDGVKLLEKAMAHKKPKVTREETVGNETILVDDPNATALALERQNAIRAEWERWLWDDAQRIERLVPIYNDKMNAIVPRQYDGSHLRLPGMSPLWRDRLRQYQRRAIWRGVAGTGNTLLFHAVGAGKTIEQTGIAMELRRLRLAHKPVVVVHGSTYEQFPAQSREAYPLAKLFAIDTDEMRRQGRNAALSQIAFGDWDLVLMPHSTFTKIPMSPESTAAYFKRRMQEFDDAKRDVLAEGREGEATKSIIRELEKAKQRLEVKLKERLAKLEAWRGEGGIWFEDLGIDWLIYDESHALKNLAYTSGAGRVKGMGDPKGSDRAYDAEMKIEYIQQIQNGRGIVFATGTPVANSVVEMFTLQKYLALEKLKDLGIEHLDAWLHTFGEISEELEATIEGTYKSPTRLRAFRNVPDLARLWLDFTDIVTTQELVEKYGVVLPEIAKNSRGKRDYETIVVPATAEHHAFMKKVQAYAEWIRQNWLEAKQQGENFLKATSYLREAALDLRMVDPGFLGESLVAEDSSENKLSVIARKVAAIHKRTTGVELAGYTAEQLNGLGVPNDNGKVNLTQLVFLSLGVNRKAHGFWPYEDLIDKMVAAGVPRAEIAIVQEHDKDREELFRKVNDGEIRVLVGSIEKMGVGVNVQRLVAAAHFADPPWRPDWMEQAEGRGRRQGNLNKEVEMFLYATEKLDEFFYDLLARKRMMIDQITRGNLNVRKIEEISLEALRYGEIVALTSENPWILKLEEAKRTLVRLEAERGGFGRQQSALRAAQRKADQEVELLTASLHRQRQLAGYLEKHPPKPFEMKVGGTVYTKSTDAGQALIRFTMATTGQEWRDIGEYRGAELQAKMGLMGQMIRVHLPLTGMGEEVRGIVVQQDDDPAGLVRRVANTLLTHVPETEARLETRRKERDEIAERVGQSWPKQAELNQAKDDVAKYEGELDAWTKQQEGTAEAREEEPPEGGAGGGPFPPAPAGKYPIGLYQDLSPEQYAWLRKLDPTKPGLGIGAMADIPDPRSPIAKTYDWMAKRLQNLPAGSKRQRLMRILGRGLYGDRWGISPEMYRFFARVEGAERLARADAERAREFLTEKLKRFRNEFGPDAGDEAYRRWEGRMTDVFDGRETPDSLPPVERQWFEQIKARIDGLTEETLQFPEEYIAAFGLRNVHDVIIERMKGTGTHLRALYTPRRQTALDDTGKVRNVLRGARVRGGMYKIRRSDKGIPHRETWSLQHADGTFSQFFDEDTAFEAYQRELKANEKKYGLSRFDRIKLYDSFDRELVSTLEPIRDLGLRIASTLTMMEHNLATLRLFDMLATVHAIEDDPDAPPPAGYRHVPDHPTFGPLRNMWVSQPVWDNLNAYDAISKNMLAAIWQTYHYAWKSGKTAWNLRTWVNNILGLNFFMALDHGFLPVRRPKFLLAGVDEMAKKGPNWRYLVAENRINVGWSREAAEHFKKLFDIENMNLQSTLGKWAEAGIRTAKRADRRVGYWYDYPDQLAIMASFLAKTAPESEGGLGMSREEAVQDLWMYPNYAEPGTYARWARKSPVGASFILFTEQSLKIMLRGMRNRPGAMLAIFAAVGLLGMVSKIILGIDEAEEDLLNQDPRRRGRAGPEAWLNRFFQPFIPWRDKDGKAGWVDLRWKFPLANDFRVEMGPNGIGVPWLFNTPATRVVTQAMSGKDLFYGTPTVAEEADMAEFLYSHLKAAAGELLPLPTMVDRGFTEVYRSWVGETEKSFAKALAHGVFGLEFKRPYLRRWDVYDAIKAEVGTPAAEKWLEMIAIYNETYRPDWRKPISPKRVIRAKVRKKASEAEKAKHGHLRRRR